MSSIPTKARELVRARQAGQCARCGTAYSEVHHRQRRREAGHAVSILVGLCSADHRDAHSRVVNAQAGGYIIPPWVEHPWTVPIKTFMGWALFMDDGTILLLEQNVGTDALEWHHDNADNLISHAAAGTLLSVRL